MFLSPEHSTLLSKQSIMLKGIPKSNTEEGSHASLAPRKNFRISYNDPLTGQKVAIEKDFENSKEFPAIDLATDFAYTAAQKGWADIIEIPLGMTDDLGSPQAQNRANREAPPVAIKYLSSKAFDHEFSVYFSVKSDNPGEEVTEEELIEALSQRLEEFRANKGLALEACGLPEQTEIVEALELPGQTT
jgi:hypothetical protein